MPSPTVTEDVYINGKWYRVRQEKDLGDDGAEGTCKPHRCLIKLDRDQDLQQKRDTLWHEVKHGIFFECGLSHEIKDGSEGPDEEKIVCRSASMEIAVMRENPDLMAFLLDETIEVEDD